MPPFVSNFSYTAAGGISQMRLGNGKFETAQFNNRLQVTQLGLGASATDAGLWKTTYEYGELDENNEVDTSSNTGNIARQTLSIGELSFVQSYRYDSLYRLTKAKEISGETETWSHEFLYDRYGNRTGFGELINGTRTSRTAPTVNASTNRFSTGQGFTYDKNGNVVQDIDAVTSQNRTFIFNADNKQAEIRDENGNPIGKYFYDGEGKRVKKITDTETTVFVYSGGKLVAEYSTALPSASPEISYTTTDHLGSPRIVTNQLGNVTSRRDFMPFGEDVPIEAGNRNEVVDQVEGGIMENGNLRTTALNYQLADGIRQRFTGYQKDKETSLDFAEARMYESRYGRFTAVDPLLASGKSANPQTFNRYVYCLNNPINCVDPTGLDGIWGFRYEGDDKWQFHYFADRAAFDAMNKSMQEANCLQGGCALYQLWTGGNYVIHGDRTGFHLMDGGKWFQFSLASPWASDQEYSDLIKASRSGGFSQDQLNVLHDAALLQREIAESDAALDEILTKIDTFLNGDPNRIYLEMGPGQNVSLLKSLVAYRKAIRGADAASDAVGGYVHEFKSGFTYSGKGTQARMRQTGRELEASQGDELVRSTFIAAPSNTAKEAFVIEHLQMMKSTRGLGPLSSNPSSPTYNKIFSPGKKYWEDFLGGDIR